MSVEQWTTFLGWSTLVHVGLLIVMALFLMVGRDWAARMHSAMFGVELARLPMVYFGYVAIYKILVIVFALVPYLVLRLAM